MTITKVQGASLDSLVVAIVSAFLSTRFVLDVCQSKGGIKITNVRLRQTKPYCGNHPKGCERPHAGKHKKASFLEGADWVEFNDRLNTVLDDLHVSAKVASSVCDLRHGQERRVNYSASTQSGNGTWIWDRFGKPDDYRACIGFKSSPSSFPFGTPGIYEAKDYSVEG